MTASERACLETHLVATHALLQLCYSSVAALVLSKRRHTPSRHSYHTSVFCFMGDQAKVCPSKSMSSYVPQQAFIFFFCLFSLSFCGPQGGYIDCRRSLLNIMIFKSMCVHMHLKRLCIRLHTHLKRFCTRVCIGVKTSVHTSACAPKACLHMYLNTYEAAYALLS